MSREIIRTDGAPAAVGPYSQGIRAGDWLFISGQIALDPASGRLVGDDAASQARQVLRNLQAVLRAAGGGVTDVVKVTVYLTDIGEFAEVNKVYDGVFGEALPARACVQVSALPKGALVEMDAVAYLG